MKQLKQTVTFEDLKAPQLVKDVVAQLSRGFPNIHKRTILNIELVKIFQMFGTKRLKVDESGRIKPINWFSMVFLPSGGGKDRLVDDLDDFVFKPYHSWYKDEAQKAIDKCDNKDIKDLKLINEVQDATSEGVVSLGKIIDEVKFGSIFTKISEFGDYIKNGDNKRKQFLSMLNQLYYCVVPTKTIKSEVFSEEIQDIIVNVLAYSDYTLFVNEMRAYFNKFLNSGYARRFMISFQELKDLKYSPLSDTEQRENFQNLEKLGQHFFEIFASIQFDTCYKLTPNAKNLLNNYVKNNYELYNSEEDPILQREINSRELKALKLSCLYACINHSQVLEIQENDIIQAIDTVEFLSQDFKRFLRYRPMTGDKYEQAYKFLRENEGLEFTKTKLLKVFTSQFGFSREPLRTDFDRVMSAIWEIAREDGYTIIYYDNKCKHGTYFTLVKEEYAIASIGEQGTMYPSTRYPY